MIASTRQRALSERRVIKRIAVRNHGPIHHNKRPQTNSKPLERKKLEKRLHTLNCGERTRYTAQPSSVVFSSALPQ